MRVDSDEMVLHAILAGILLNLIYVLVVKIEKLYSTPPPPPKRIQTSQDTLNFRAHVDAFNLREVNM